MKRRIVISVVFLIVVLVACRKDAPPTGIDHRPLLPSVPYNYIAASNFPASFLYPPLNFINSQPSWNPTTNWGATLGRVLFYDVNLSANNSTACSSCHQQAHGFADTKPFSEGFLGGNTARNSMAILNTRFSFRYFWDLRANGLEQQVLMPVMNSVEMGMDTTELAIKLSGVPYYPDLFYKAFGDSTVSVYNISRALAQFVRSINSWNSRFDEGLTNGFANFTPLERDGETYFMSGQFNCNHCHNTNNLYGQQPFNNGLDSVFVDIGVEQTTGDPADHGKFKAPTLRNIGLTAPYMHDGRFATLEDVVEHYNSGIMPSATLDDRLTVEGIIGGTPKRYNMTAYQKAALVAFLKTLTDDVLIADPKYSDPFWH